MKALLDGLRALGAKRLLLAGGVAAAVFALLAALALFGSQTRMALLYGDLDLGESGRIVEQLTRQHAAYQLAANGSQILVPGDDVAKLRVALAKDGLPSGGSVGYEIFDRDNALTATQFQQQINQLRALEGELGRTIGMIAGIRAARVHLVLPAREPFARDRQEAQASVMLTMAGSARLDREGVQAVLTLVAAAVPGLKPANIAIVDSRGSLLAKAGEPTGAIAGQANAEETRHALEARLGHGVEDMLERTLGPGKVRAEASVEMDYDRINETQEKFDPDGQVPRSTQTVNSSSKTSERDGTVSVQNSLPNADAAAGGQTGTQETRQEETTNYEITRTIRTMVREQPSIKRISLAVMVDGVAEVPAEAKPGTAPVWQPRTAEELARITALVQSAIGYDAKRGDHVEVASMQFAAPDEQAPPPAGLFGLGFARGDWLHLAETLALAAAGLAAVLLVLRPMLLRLIIEPATAAIAHQGGTQTAADLLTGPPGAATPGPALAAASSLVAADDDMVQLANIDGQMRASSIRRIATLVERHPEATVSIVRGWITEGAG
jgi:flagellar M-ring protein FliF